MNFGTYIHEIFELGVNAVRLADLMPIAAGLKEKYKIDASYAKQTETCLRNFIRLNTDFLSKGAETLGTEIEYKIDLVDGITATGVIDRVLRSNKGNILVVDYKTSKREKSKTQLFQDPQLRGYALAACKLYDIPVANAKDRIICAHYYPTSNNFVPINYPQSELLKHQKKIIDISWNIRKATLDSLTPNKNEYCDYCQYKHICPLFQDGETIKCNLLLEEKRKEDAKILAESKSPGL